MDINKGTDDIKRNFNEFSTNAQEAGETLSEQVKDSVSELYEEGKKKLNNMEECAEDYANEVIQKIKENPLTSILIAGGLGYLISKLLKK